jgi:hypothetical protein
VGAQPGKSPRAGAFLFLFIHFGKQNARKGEVAVNKKETPDPASQKPK